MNESELEDQLRALAPAAPSADLAARIERDLISAPAPAPVARTAGVLARPARSSAAWRWLRDLGWAAAGAATMLAGITFFSPSSERAAPPSGVVESQPIGAAPVAEEQAFEPAETSRELVSVNGSDEVLETEDGPVRQVRYTYLERLAWAHPGTGARLEIEVPREDVYLLPVSLQ